MPTSSSRFPRLTYKSAAISARRDHPRAATTLGMSTPSRRRKPNRNSLSRMHSMRKSRPMSSRPLVDAAHESRGSRAVYHATTASARAAEMRSQRGPVFEDELRERPSRSGTDLGEVSRRFNSGLFAEREEPKRVTRVVVKRRVVRGSPVFRPATEQELDDFLQVERSREMIPLPEAEIDIPPTLDSPFYEHFETDRDVCSLCAGPLPAKKALSKKGIRRMSSLLSRGAYDDDEVLKISEMAAMDEYNAVAHFLREIRRYRKETIVNVQEKAERPDRKRKEKKRRVVEEKETKDLNLKDLKRSASADDPALMRAVQRQERMIATARKKMKNTARRSRSEVFGVNAEWKGDGADNSEEDEEAADSLRILTAIEPVDPTEALDDDDADRNNSFANEPFARRRGLRISGESGILGRLRSLRRKGQVPT